MDDSSLGTAGALELSAAEGMFSKSEDWVAKATHDAKGRLLVTLVLMDRAAKAVTRQEKEGASSSWIS